MTTIINPNTILVLNLVVFVANAILGWVVVRANPRVKANLLFGVYAFSLALWNITLFLTIVSAGGPILQLWWSRLAFSFYLTMINGFLYFSLIYPGFGHIKQWLAVFFWSFTALLFVLTLTPWLVRGDIRIIDGFITGSLGPLMPFFSWYYAVLIGLSIVALVRKLFLYRGIEKVRLWYVLFGFSVFAVPMILTNIVLPVFFGVFQYNNLGPLFSLPMLVIISYAIVKHRFMDVREIVARSTAYFLSVVVLGLFYSFGMSSISTFIAKGSITGDVLLISTLLTLITAFSFQPLLNLFRKITNRVFYREDYDENALLYSLALIMASNINLSSLLNRLINEILAKIQIAKGAFVIVDDKKISHLAFQGYVESPRFSDKDLDELLSQPKIVIFDELSEGPIKETMRKLEVSVILPLRAGEEQEDFLLLSEKMSGGLYSEKDVRFLKVFAPEAAAAIKNASNFERLKRLDEVKSEFITVVSHQLRTPLSAARWNFELLLENSFGKLSAKVENVVRSIYQAVMALNNGVNNLISIIEIEERKIVIRKEKVNFDRDIVEKAIVSLEGEIQEKKITVKREFSLPESLVVDANKVRRICETLIDNAVRYSPEGSTVVVSTALRKKASQDEILFSVQDQGIGVLEENRELIFNKFFRGERAKEMSPGGFGLSLFMAKSYAELFGGSLWLGSKTPPGSVFYFSLPIKEVKPQSKI